MNNNESKPTIYRRSALAEEEVIPPRQQWSFSGPFGTWDRAQLQRGFKVYREVCSVCHGMKFVAFRNLADLGFSEGQIKTIAEPAEGSESGEAGLEPIAFTATTMHVYVRPLVTGLTVIGEESPLTVRAAPVVGVHLAA